LVRREPVDHHLVDGGAERGGEAVVALVGGLPAAREYSILSDLIELGGGHAHAQRRLDGLQGRAVDGTGLGHDLELGAALEDHALTPSSTSAMRSWTSSSVPTPLTRCSLPAAR